MDPAEFNQDDDVVEVCDDEEIPENNGAFDDGSSWSTEEMGDDDEDAEDDDDDDDDHDGPEIVPTQDDAVVVFRRHTDEVYSVHIDPVSCLLAVTGGKDDRAFVWNITSGDVLFECTGHSQSVVSSEFNWNGNLVATGDLDGLVKVWRVENGEELCQKQFSEIQWLKWHPAGQVLMAGTSSPCGADGDVILWEIASGMERYLPGSGASRCNAGKFLPDGKRAVAGHDSGDVKVWNLKNGACIHKIHAHNAAVTVVDCHPDGKLLLTASIDNTACLIHADNGQILTRYQHPTTDVTEDNIGVFTVAFASKNYKYLATGTKTGLLTIWEYSTNTERHKCFHTAAIERLIWHPTEPFIYTCTADGTICVWDARNGHQMACWRGHTRGIYDMELSRDGTHMVTVSYDKTSRVFISSPSSS